jgi:hypothetical protein
MKDTTMRTIVASALLAITAPIWAHEGHGQGDVHWHAGDLLALLAIGAVVAVWLWQRGRR